MEDTEKKVVILLCDMVRYSQKTADMRPVEIRDFIVEYHRNLQAIINNNSDEYQAIEPLAGDGAISIFEDRKGKSKSEIYDRAICAAIDMAHAMERGTIPNTRIGIFAGDILEARIDGNVMRFGASFSVASRLEELCGYFNTKFLMDREVAFRQISERKNIVSIGKITPKNFFHPIHVYTIYKPGIHNCPREIDRNKLAKFIKLKNDAVRLFCGNELQGIRTDFSLAREKLEEVQKVFVSMTGSKDVPSERLLEYIRNTQFPGDEFRKVGMNISRDYWEHS